MIKEKNGNKFISFSVAHSDSYVNSQGVKSEKTVWVSCLKTGESKILDYLKKGTKVFVRGDLNVSQYESNGQQNVSVSCNVREIQLLGGIRSQNDQGYNLITDSPSVDPAYKLPEQQQVQQPLVTNDDLPF